LELQATTVSTRLQTSLSTNLNDVISSALIWLLPPGDTAPLLLRASNAASFLADGISPGSLITLFGLNLGPRTGAGPSLDGSQVSTSIQGIRVLVDAAPSPLLYVQGEQITATAPYNIASAGSVSLRVEAQGQNSNTITLPVSAVTPGVFTLNSGGFGQGLILNQDGSINTQFRPARRGSTVLFFASGLGQTNPSVPSGQMAPIASAKPTQPMWVSLGGQTAALSSISPRTDFPGLFQLTVQVPQEIEAGDAVPFQLVAGDQMSQSGVTIAVI
jgi:uncharacterized protein (TIGR03437 family)